MGTEFKPRNDVGEEPRYEVLNEAVLADGEAPAPYQALTHIRCGHKHIARVTGGDKYAELEYVVVGQSRVTRKDQRGTFTYEETTIVASDEHASIEPAVLYTVPRIIPVEHAMFAVGEIPK